MKITVDKKEPRVVAIRNTKTGYVGIVLDDKRSLWLHESGERSLTHAGYALEEILSGKIPENVELIMEGSTVTVEFS